MIEQAARKTPTRAKSAGLIDLDAMLFQRSTTPATIRLGGKDFTLRRDLPGEEVVQFWAHIAASEDAKAYGVLVGEDDGQALHAMVRSLPADIFLHAYRQILEAAGLKTKPPVEDPADEGDDAGES
jgi:hypothetical protein